MQDNRGADLSSGNVIHLADVKGSELAAMARLDPEVRGFLKLIDDEDLRLEAIRLLKKAIAKKSS